MVRLKVHYFSPQLPVFVFQFLMVRLKDRLQAKQNQADKHFNSLWFD